MRRRRLRLAQRWLEPYLFVLPAFAGFGFLVIYPIVEAVDLSLRDASLLLGTSSDAPFVGLDNYRELLGDPAFWSSLRVTVFYTVLGVAGAFGAGLGLALLLHQRILGRSWLRTIMLTPWVLPQIVGAYVWMLLLDPQFGAVNEMLNRIGLLQENSQLAWLTGTNTSLLAVSVVTVWRFFPIAMLMLLAALQGVDESLYEAAQLDGAGTLARFRAVTWPGIRPVASLVLLLLVIWNFRHFGTIYVMTQGGPAGATETITIRTYLEAFNNYDLGAASALGIISLLITLIFSVAYLSFVRRSRMREV